MVDLIAVVALIVSIVSAFFVALKEGVGLIHDYRESETTQKRKKEIDESLRNEVKEKIKKFTQEYITNVGKDESEKLEEIENLGYASILSRDATKTIINNIISQTKNGFKNLALALYAFFMTVVFWGLFDFNTSNWQIFVLLSFLAIFTAILFVWAISNFKRHSYLREKFIQLYENPNIKFCWELFDELTEKNLGF